MNRCKSCGGYECLLTWRKIDSRLFGIGFVCWAGMLVVHVLYEFVALGSLEQWMHHGVDLLSLSSVSSGVSDLQVTMVQWTIKTATALFRNQWFHHLCGHSFAWVILVTIWGEGFIGGLKDASQVQFLTISPVSRVNNCYILLVAHLLFS